MVELESICLHNMLHLILYKKNFQKLRLCNTLIYYLFSTVSQKQRQLCGMEIRMNHMVIEWGCTELYGDGLRMWMNQM